MKVTLGNEKKLATFKAKDLGPYDFVIARGAAGIPDYYPCVAFLVSPYIIVGFTASGQVYSWDRASQTNFEFVRLDTSLTLEND